MLRFIIRAHPLFVGSSVEWAARVSERGVWVKQLLQTQVRCSSSLSLSRHCLQGVLKLDFSSSSEVESPARVMVC